MGQKTVHPATPYKSCNTGAYGTASHMLIRQWRFPHQFRYDEIRVGAFSDRLDFKHWQKCLKKHMRLCDINTDSIESWFRNSKVEKIMSFIVELLETEDSWTGFRVRVTVKGNGQCAWHFDLFKKNPDSKTEVFSGENAPNIAEKTLSDA
jgi:hypothetical protein